ncbi:unnamed protein product [Diatraea saccharalis]|uniref:Uncharacterized protein n=1 Tax=Diatraea saccharalis TaxID=40085 RepID=A0A9N9QUQ6_9NEOP|nr:unnamed protein product [Diatraea saccharalis]
MEAMELAGQWRREWAGTAEYGKVTEGGVTRRIARAMEVLNASAPGARVRVMRAAYHSTSGPGIPTSSYMLHSSRRVISSGFNLLESPTYPSKPLEISSTPLEELNDPNIETQNYKVTEPDDMEISEPSKWRGASNKSNLRMPSEESSSTENASIIDLDSRSSHKGLHRKFSGDSENSDVMNTFKRNSSRTSPLLDAPVTLSTLKYKSLLNNSNEWNNRRKSYSFEDSSPLNEVILQSNDTLAMESSTDSGICKSSEIVNDFTEDARRIDISCDAREKFNVVQRSPNEWITKNKFYRGSNFKPYKEPYIMEEEPRENNIALQSKGKVSITVPITLEDDNYNLNNNQMIDDGERKIKKVEFCKTELHFTAESGKVNIIATDDKPPPTNDFRKRRSAFVPINEKFEKPITLFGEKGDFLKTSQVDENGIKNFHGPVELDDNTAATKSILKNRIPKPKPYLLGENMVFGDSTNASLSDDFPAPTGVSITNKQLQRKKNDINDENLYDLNTNTDKSFRDSLRANNKGPLKGFSSNSGKLIQENTNIRKGKTSDNNSNWNDTKIFQISPVQNARTRQLRESELTYFGINNQQKTIYNKTKCNNNIQISSSEPKFLDDTFESVRLIKQISNSSQNSEAESDESPDYQNLPVKSNFAPIPTPRTREKYKNSDERITILRPIVERANESIIVPQEPRRSRSKKQEALGHTNRSLSEPVKKHFENSLRRHDELRHSNRKDDKQQRDTEQKKIKEKMIIKKSVDDVRNGHHNDVESDKDLSIYANVIVDKGDSLHYNSLNSRQKSDRRVSSLEKSKEERISKSDADSLRKKQDSVKKTSRHQRTEKLSTPEYSKNRTNTDSTISRKTNKIDKTELKDSKLNSEKEYKGDNSRQTINNQVKNNETPKDVILKVKLDSKLATNHLRKESSKNNSSIQRESNHKNIEPLVIEHAVKSKDLRTIDRSGADKNSLSNSRRTARRSEYVIKYDDKNGTVSSVSKVREGHGTSRQKHISKEKNKNSRDTKRGRNNEISTLRK